jgi:hypothetical protein
MTVQAELELDPPRPVRPALRARAVRAGRAFLHWTPVWVPLLVLVQLLLLGLRPARATAERLQRAEAEVRARVDALETEARELALQGRMLEDPVYRERVRRSLIDPAAGPLTLERARTARP